jgi:predicted nucleic acid-binding protein
MSVYLDASVLVPLFIDDPHTSKAEQLLAPAAVLMVSDFAAAEFASALARRLRMRELTEDDARSAFALFDRWTGVETQYVRLLPEDLAGASALLRRLELPIRTPDAVNIVIAQRLGAHLATFDQRMAQCARRLGLSLAVT